MDDTNTILDTTPVVDASAEPVVADESLVQVSAVETAPLVETPAEFTEVEAASGFAEGTILPSKEKIVGSFDETGALTGWHKEIA